LPITSRANEAGAGFNEAGCDPVNKGIVVFDSSGNAGIGGGEITFSLLDRSAAKPIAGREKGSRLRGFLSSTVFAGRAGSKTMAGCGAIFCGR
jgi:hypothetical protein